MEYNPIEVISKLDFADTALRNRLLEHYNPADSIFENLSLAINGPDIAKANTGDLICLNSAQDSLDLLEKISTVYNLVRSPEGGIKSLGGKSKKGKKNKKQNSNDSDSEEAKVDRKRMSKSNKNQKNKRERTEEVEIDDENKF